MNSLSVSPKMAYIYSYWPVISIIAFILLISGCQNQNAQQSSNQTHNEIGYDVEQRLEELGITLSPPTPPTANYVRAVKTGNLVYLAGHGPDKPEGGQIHGKMGTDELTLEEGQLAARYTGISLLNSLKAEIGDLNRVNRIVKVLGMVNAEPTYTEHSQVINGFSDLMVKVFGEEVGKHARAAVGMSSLPGNIPVEIQMIVEIKE